MDNKYLAITIILVSLAVGGSIYILAKPDPQVTIETTEPSTSSAKPTMETDKLVIEDQKIGTGAEAVVGKTITVNYTGTFTNGTMFDSSLNPGRTPFTFTLGAGEVIQGWDQGFAGMKVGGKRKLTVPPSLGYGPNDYSSIPGNSTLIFEVELLSVE